MISTGAMVKFGKVYQNLMVDMQATNVKLVDRGLSHGDGKRPVRAAKRRKPYSNKPITM